MGEVYTVTSCVQNNTDIAFLLHCLVMQQEQQFEKKDPGFVNIRKENACGRGKNHSHQK